MAEDDADLRGLLRHLLEGEGFQVIPAADGAQALLLATRTQPDLIILDVLMPHADGWEVLAQLRQFSDAPVLMLTALGQPADRVRGLALGADDYLPKPFHPPELLLRLRSLVRRGPRGAAVEGRAAENLRFPGLIIDQARGMVNDEAIPAKEYALLVTLASQPGRVFSRAELGELVWGEETDFDERTLHTHVKRLRRRIESDRWRYIHTVWGVGYHFSATCDEP